MSRIAGGQFVGFVAATLVMWIVTSPSDLAHPLSVWMLWATTGAVLGGQLAGARP